jgi:GntR family transcriptional regulator
MVFFMHKAAQAPDRREGNCVVHHVHKGCIEMATEAAEVVDHTGRPKYLEVAASLRSAIAAGTYPVGGELPSTARLTESFGVSTTVVRAAVRELRDEGLVVGQPGKAVYVRAVPAETRRAADGGADIGSLDAKLRQLSDTVQATLRDLEARVAALEAHSNHSER